jgi:hypothetical protein
MHREMRNVYKVCLENWDGKEHLEEISTDRRIILKY